MKSISCTLEHTPANLGSGKVASPVHITSSQLWFQQRMLFEIDLLEDPMKSGLWHINIPRQDFEVHPIFQRCIRRFCLPDSTTVVSLSICKQYIRTLFSIMIDLPLLYLLWYLIEDSPTGLGETGKKFAQALIDPLRSSPCFLLASRYKNMDFLRIEDLTRKPKPSVCLCPAGVRWQY